jgi:hypothetical protein
MGFFMGFFAPSGNRILKKRAKKGQKKRGKKAPLK